MAVQSRDQSPVVFERFQGHAQRVSSIRSAYDSVLWPCSDEERSAAANAPSNSQPSANEHADAQPSTPTKNDIRMETGDVASTSEPEKEQKADEARLRPRHCPSGFIIAFQSAQQCNKS